MKTFLESKRIYLREFSTADEEELLDLDSDPEVMKYLTNGKPSSREGIQRMLTRVSAQLDESNGKYGVWSAVEKATNQFVGWFHLFPPRDEPENPHRLFLGYRLKRTYWGKGYATEVSSALIKLAFEEYGATEVCAQSMKANLGSQRVMEKVGMSFTCEFKEKSFPEGFQDAVLFSIKN